MAGERKIMQQRRNKEFDKEIVSMYEEGSPISDIAAKIHMDQKAIYRILKDNHVVMKNGQTKRKKGVDRKSETAIRKQDIDHLRKNIKVGDTVSTIVESYSDDIEEPCMKSRKKFTVEGITKHGIIARGKNYRQWMPTMISYVELIINRATVE